MVACSPVCLHEDRILVCLLRKVNSEDVLVETQAQKDCTIVPSEGDIFLHRKDFPCLPKLGFPGHTSCVVFAQLNEAAKVVRTSEANKAGAEAVFSLVAFSNC